MLHRGLTRAIEAVESGVVSVPNGDAWRVIQALELMRRCSSAMERVAGIEHADTVARMGEAARYIDAAAGRLWLYSLTSSADHAAGLAEGLWKTALDVAWCVLRSGAVTTIRDVEAMTEVPRG